MSFDGVVIEVPLFEPHKIPIRLGYPGPIHFTGEDPRADPAILRSLEALGKLR
jgi:hypothetical protein